MNYRLRFVILKTNAIKSERVAKIDTKKPHFISFHYQFCAS